MKKKVVSNSVSIFFRDLSFDENDDWMIKSLSKSDKSDPDFIPMQDDDTEQMILKVPRSLDFTKNKALLVYESEIKKLLKLCNKCGDPILESKEMKSEGSNYRVKMTCLQGHATEWSSQPALTSTYGN